MADIGNPEIKENPQITVACVPHIGPYWELNDCFAKLLKWITDNNIETKSPVMGLYYDNPKEVSMDKLRSDAAVCVPDDTQQSGEIKIKKLPPTKTVCLLYKGSYADQAKFKAYGNIINFIEENGLELDNEKPLREIYLNSPQEVDEKDLETEIHMPVKE